MSRYMPTPHEIRKACDEIQESWTDDERLQRRSGFNKTDLYLLRWTPPEISISDDLRYNIVDTDCHITDTEYP